MFSQCKVDKHEFTCKQVNKKWVIIQEGKSRVKLAEVLNTYAGDSVTGGRGGNEGVSRYITPRARRLHVLDPGTKSCMYVHEWHRQE